MSSVFHDVGKTLLAVGGTLVSGDSTQTNGGNNSLNTSGASQTKQADYTKGCPPSDTAWYEFPATDAATASQVNANIPGGSTLGGALGCWLMIDAYPSANIQMLRFGNSGQNYLGLSSAGKLFLQMGGASQGTDPTALPLKQWIWVAVTFNMSTNTAYYGWWDIKGVQQRNYTSVAGTLTAVGSSICIFGKIATAGIFGPWRMASFRQTNDSITTLIPPVIPPGIRGPGVAA